jgi:hypothetical protein
MIPFIPSFAQLVKMPSTFVIFIMLAVLMIGSEAIYGELSGRMTTVLIVYILLLLMSRAEMPKKEHKSRTIIQSIPAFLIMFFITLFVMIGIQPFTGELIAASTLESSLEFVAVFGFMHAFVKSYIEEEVFRSRLSVMIGELGQAIAFGAFHFFILLMVFGFSPMLIAAMGWLAGLGLLWGFVENKFGIEGSTGSHFAYNLAAFGMVPVIFGALVI